MDGEFISTDIRYRGVNSVAGSEDGGDIKSGAVILSGGGMDMDSGEGEKDAKDTASVDETIGRDIDGGASSNIDTEVKVEREKGGVTNKVRFASGGAGSTGSESTDSDGGDTKSGGDGVINSASVAIGEDTNSGGSAIINIGNEIKGEKDKSGTNNVESASGGAEATESVSTNPGDSVDNSGGGSSEGASKSKCGGVSVGAVPRISRMRLREILQHA